MSFPRYNVLSFLYCYDTIMKLSAHGVVVTSLPPMQWPWVRFPVRASFFFLPAPQWVSPKHPHLSVNEQINMTTYVNSRIASPCFVFLVIHLFCLDSIASASYPSGYSSSGFTGRVDTTTTTTTTVAQGDGIRRPDGLPTAHSLSSSGSWEDENFLLPENKVAFEDHVAAWRQSQSQLHTEESIRPSTVDEQGRTKLITPHILSKASLSMWFFILMWRAMAHYEMVDVPSMVWRQVAIIPPAILFVANMVGFVLTVTTPSALRSTKLKFKALLNLNKLVEILLIIYYFLRLTILPNPFVQKEIYVGKMLYCVMYLVFSQGLTKVSWGAAIEQQQTNYYDDTSGTNFNYNADNLNFNDGYIREEDTQNY